MSIPEPEFKITVYQLAAINKDMGYIWGEHYSSKVDYLRSLKSKCFEYLDTI